MPPSPIKTQIATVSYHAVTGLGGLFLYCSAFYMAGFYWQLGVRHADEK